MDFFIQVQGQDLSVCRQRTNRQGRWQRSCLRIESHCRHLDRHWYHLGFGCLVRLISFIFAQLVERFVRQLGHDPFGEVVFAHQLIVFHPLKPLRTIHFFPRFTVAYYRSNQGIETAVASAIFGNETTVFNDKVLNGYLHGTHFCATSAK